MKLTALKLDGETLPGSAYELTDDTLTIHSPPKSDFELECTTEIRPDKNTLLEGLYMSQGIYCTQCGYCSIHAPVDRSTCSIPQPDMSGLGFCR